MSFSSLTINQLIIDFFTLKYIILKDMLVYTTTLRLTTEHIYFESFEQQSIILLSFLGFQQIGVNMMDDTKIIKNLLNENDRYLKKYGS